MHWRTSEQLTSLFWPSFQVGQKVQIVGDDLLVTNPTRVKKAFVGPLWQHCFVEKNHEKWIEMTEWKVTWVFVVLQSMVRNVIRTIIVGMLFWTDSVWNTCLTITCKTNIGDTSWIILRCCAGLGSRSLQCALAEGMGRSLKRLTIFIHWNNGIDFGGSVIFQVDMWSGKSDWIHHRGHWGRERIEREVDVTCRCTEISGVSCDNSCVKQSHFATLGCNHVSKCWMGRHGVSSFGWDRGPSVVMTLNIFCQLPVALHDECGPRTPSSLIWL